MEMEFFVPPGEADEWYRYWIDARHRWYLDLGLRGENLRIREHDADERSHYSLATSDLEYLYPIGWQELEGVANRGDYDLTQHTRESGTKLEWIDPDGRVTRRTSSSLPSRSTGSCSPSSATPTTRRWSETVNASSSGSIHGSRRSRRRSSRSCRATKGWRDAPRALYEELRRYHVVEHDDSGQIGRRYRRQDEIGTPWAFTVDEQTLEDETVTVRDRDSLAQERLPIGGVREWLDDALERDWSSPHSG